MGQLVVKKRADQLQVEDQFVFTETLGGQGELLTVSGWANLFGTIHIATEELDFQLEVTDKQMLLMV